ncbi:hypothetical protein ES703_95173 [subsurface metagenome]
MCKFGGMERGHRSEATDRLSELEQKTDHSSEEIGYLTLFSPIKARRYVPMENVPGQNHRIERRGTAYLAVILFIDGSKSLCTL